jgi:hypothetical protein
MVARGAAPTRPVFALHVSDIGRAAVRLHPEQFLEVDRLPIGFQFRGRLFVAAIRACCNDNMTHLAVVSSRPSAPLPAAHLLILQTFSHLKMMLEGRKRLAGPVLQVRIIAALGITFEQRNRVLVGADLIRSVVGAEVLAA